MDVIGFCVFVNEKVGLGDCCIVVLFDGYLCVKKIVIVMKMDVVGWDDIIEWLMEVDVLWEDWDVVILFFVFICD